MTKAAEECARVNSWYGCKFEPRYDIGVPDLSQFKSAKFDNADSIERFRPKTYIYDICIRCGKTVKRDQAG